MAKKKAPSRELTKFTVFLAAVVSILFGIVLWYGYWDLEKVFALLFFVGGIGKLLYSILLK